jgi:hypothetical protein
VDLLPSVFRGVPTFFGAESVAALQYPPVSEQVKKRCRWLLTFAAGPLAKAAAAAPPAGEAPPFGGASVDANALGWALAAVSSRAFRHALLCTFAFTHVVIVFASLSRAAHASLQGARHERAGVHAAADRHLQPLLRAQR